MESQLGNHGCGYPCHHITDRSVFKGSQRQTWVSNLVNLVFQVNSGSIYSTNMVAFVFVGIVVNAHWQHAFVIVHNGVSPGVMLRDAIGYMSWLSLVRIYGTLNSARYISGPFRPLALPFIRALRNPAFQQDIARPHASGIVRIFLDTENV
ncbi:transposable element Tcb1 transposase [Trichonephila clavipes]|nr:transposable element Tcb1 transposase [Trichonephila clavipes]